MSLLWKLIPPPYGVIVHYGLIVLLLAGIAGFSYVKGIDHQQMKDAAADDQTRIAAAAFNHKQAAALAPIAAQAEKQHEQDQVFQPVAQAAIDHHLRAERLRQCPAAIPAGAGMPAVRSSGDDGSAAASADAAGPGPAQAAVDDHIAHDASLYRPCFDAYSALKATAIAAGADKP